VGDELTARFIDELRTLEHEDTVSSHRALGERLRTLTGADFAMSFAVHEHDGTPRYAEPMAIGDDQLGAMTEAHEGAPIVGHPFTTGGPHPYERNKFYDIITGRPRHTWEELPVYYSYYAPLEISDQPRLLVYEHERLVHYVSVGLRGGKRFSATARRRLERVTEDVNAVVIAIDRLRLADGSVDDAFAQYRPDGVCDFATAPARVLLDASPALRERLAKRVVAIDQGKSDRGWSVAGPHACEIVRMDGALGVRYLVAWRLLQHPRHAASGLSSRQREVAVYAAAGATQREIAKALSISPNTVKTHLKAVYQLLGVGSRVELAAALGR